MMASIISLIGAPGSGKGTYGSLLASRILKASFLSVGDILREQSDENEHLSSVMLSGALVEDDLVTELVIQSLENKRTGKNLIILDGFPRNSTQTNLLEKWPTHLQPSLALHIDVPDHICSIKILGRRKCNICNKSWNINGVDTDGFNMPPMLPGKGTCTCKVECNSDLHWEKRDDDTEETIRQRFQVYHNETKPVLQYWQKKGQLLRFVPYNGVQDIDKLEKLVKQNC